MIEARTLTKRYGGKLAVDGLTFTVRPGAVTGFLGLLPESVSDAAYRYLPTPAGAAISSVHQDPLTLSPWTGLALFCLYTAIVLGLAAWQLRRRNA